jgi:MoxR-like ATPase
MDAQGELKKMRDEIHRVIVGQDHAIDLVLTCLLANGHCLITGVPGLAKTLLARTVAASLGLKFSRIQFTPDLMPMDLLGTEILRSKGQEMEFEWVPGPVFANLILADEINRATPRTQSALLQAMQEKEIHVLGRHFVLEAPFMVLATRNPLDQEGTFPLPEAQLDRFLMNIEMTYPSSDEEVGMLKMKGKEETAQIKQVLSRENLLEFQRDVYRVAVSEQMLKDIVSLVQKTRPESNDALKDRVAWGAGPRASEALLHCARSYAFLLGEKVLEWKHVQSVALAVLNHRVEFRLGFSSPFREKERLLREFLG